MTLLTEQEKILFKITCEKAACYSRRMKHASSVERQSIDSLKLSFNVEEFSGYIKKWLLS